jgi:hypothetical protein
MGRYISKHGSIYFTSLHQLQRAISSSVINNAQFSKVPFLQIRVYLYERTEKIRDEHFTTAGRHPYRSRTVHLQRADKARQVWDWCMQHSYSGSLRTKSLRYGHTRWIPPIENLANNLQIAKQSAVTKVFEMAYNHVSNYWRNSFQILYEGKLQFVSISSNFSSTESTTHTSRL